MTPPIENQRSEDNTVRIATAASIPKVLKQLGYDPVPLLAELGLELSLFDDPDNMIPYALRSQLIQLCVKTTHCQHFGLLLGQHTGLSSAGLVRFLVQQSSNVQTALQLLVRYTGVVDQNQQMTRSIFDGKFVIIKQLKSHCVSITPPI